MKLKLLGAALVAALGGLLFGFDTAVISGTTDWLKATYQLSGFWLGFTVSSALIGTIIGSIVVGWPADRFGRRGVLFVLALFYFATAVGCAVAWDWSAFVFFRFLGGLAVGGASVVSPMYIAELSPARLRGRLVAITQFNIVLGILLAYFSNWVISHFFGASLGELQCRWMFGVQAAPAAIFFLLLFGTPQSPRWLVAKGRLPEARTVLEQCGTDGGNAEDEIREIQGSLDVDHHSLAEPFYCRKYRKPILLAVAIAMFNQLSGINALIYYTASIFKMAGYAQADALLQSVIIGLVNLVFTMAAMTVIDHFGRKKLMLVGSLGYIVSLGAAAYAFFRIQGVDSALKQHLVDEVTRNGVVGMYGLVLMISLVVFIASHAFGQGAVIWVFISEIFPNRVRARGQALGSFTHWVMAAAISWTFPVFAAQAGWVVFAFYAVCMVGQLIWVLAVMPETKGITLEKIQKTLGIE